MRIPTFPRSGRRTPSSTQSILKPTDLESEAFDAADRVDRILGGSRAFLSEALAYEASWILDVCCGAASFTRDLLGEARARGRRLEMVALETSDLVLERARRLTGEEPLLRFVRSETGSMPFPDRAFDLAICRLALHRFDSEGAIALLRESRRVAKNVLVYDFERTGHGAFAAATVARFRSNGRPKFDATLPLKSAFRSAELEEFAALAGWNAPSVRRLGWSRLVLRDG